jgi:hypothetical protein
MRPRVALCLGAPGAVHKRAARAGEAREHLTRATAMFREMAMNFWLEQADTAMVGSA